MIPTSKETEELIWYNLVGTYRTVDLKSKNRLQNEQIISTDKNESLRIIGILFDKIQIRKHLIRQILLIPDDREVLH